MAGGSLVKLYIYNSGAQQIADFYSQPPTGEILWIGHGWTEFTSDTGYTHEHVGGFYSSNGEITFSETLLEQAIEPKVRLLSPLDKLEILTNQVSALPTEKQVFLLAPSRLSGIALALNAGNLEVAKGVIEQFPTGNDPELISLQTQALQILDT